jgi:hypothetical protein
MMYRLPLRFVRQHKAINRFIVILIPSSLFVTNDLSTGPDFEMDEQRLTTLFLHPDIEFQDPDNRRVLVRELKVCYTSVVHAMLY